MVKIQNYTQLLYSKNGKKSSIKRNVSRSRKEKFTIWQKILTSRFFFSFDDHIQHFTSLFKPCLLRQMERCMILDVAFIEDFRHPASQQFPAKANGIRKRISFFAIRFFCPYADLGFLFSVKVAVLNAPGDKLTSILYSEPTIRVIISVPHFSFKTKFSQIVRNVI